MGDTLGLERPEESEISIDLEDTAAEESTAEESTTEESTDGNTTEEESNEGNTTEEESTEAPTTASDVPDVRVAEEATSSNVKETTTNVKETSTNKNETTTNVNETTTPVTATPDMSKVVNAIKESGFTNVVPSAIINTLLICLVAAYNM